MTLTGNNPIEADGSYTAEVTAGKQYLLTLKGVFDGATVALQTWNDVLSDFSDVADGTWTAEAEIRFVAPSNKVLLVVTNDGASTAIGVTLTPLV